jgi:hypothetical protein
MLTPTGTRNLAVQSISMLKNYKIDYTYDLSEHRVSERIQSSTINMLSSLNQNINFGQLYVPVLPLKILRHQNLHFYYILQYRKEPG